MLRIKYENVSLFHALLSMLLLAVLVFNSIGCIGLFIIERHETRKDSEFKIRHLTDLLFVRIVQDSGNGPQPVLLNKHELRFEGRMYDIVYRRTNGHEVSYFALPDERDTQSFASLNRVIQLQSQNNRNHHTLLSWFKSYIPVTSAGLSRFIPANIPFFSYPPTDQLPQSPFSDIPTPPPRPV